MFSNALVVTILVILMTSLIGFYVKMRGRDRCLRDLDDFQVTIETKDDHVAWGTLRTYATGVELLYIDADPNVETPPASVGNSLSPAGEGDSSSPPWALRGGLRGGR